MRYGLFVALVWLATSVAGCGGSELRPDQQKEYDRLTAERTDINQRVGKATRRADAAFTEMGKAEQSKRLLIKDAAMCGAEVEGQTIGPFPWGQKKTAKLRKKKNVKLSGISCATYRLQVVK